MSLKWIAERLAMGSWTNVSNLLGVERAKTAINFTKLARLRGFDLQFENLHDASR